MRLLFFSSSLSGGGAERALVNLSNELVNQGHDVIISLNENKLAYEVDGNVRLVIAPNEDWYSGNNLILILLRKIKRHFRNSKHTKTVIRDAKPDIIISFLQCNIGAIIKWHGKIPIISSEHNAYDRRLGLRNYVNRFVLNRMFNKVFVLSSFDIGYASAKGLKNVVYMPNPNTFEEINIKNYNELFQERRGILMCGRLDAWYIKGFDIAIKVFARVASQYPDMFLDIAGGGTEKSVQEIKSIAVKYGVADQVRFLGACNNMRELYTSHQVFLLSSRTEGFPMVIGEAMSQGLPCIAFEKLAFSIIVNECDGLLVEDQSVDEMSDALRYLIENDRVRYDLGLHAIRNIGRFSRRNIAERWIKNFNSLISK